jgi:UDP-N-acetyl-D-mannosaminuronic acid dehydrogenase
VSRACVIGLGTIGLPTAALLAARGWQVAGCDTDPAVIAAVRAGRAPFREVGLDALVRAAVESGRLHAAAEPAAADHFVIAVPTPLAEGRRAGLAAVWAATDALAPLLRPGNTVILESTSPVGTTERLAARLAALRPDLVLPRPGGAPCPGTVHVAYCPERVLPGRMLEELAANDRILGGVGAGCAAAALPLYEAFVAGRIELAASRMAELVKLAENAFRDVNIAFANELAGIAEGLGLDPWQAIALANRHPRVDILRPGPGVGGHCIAVDPWFLAEAAPGAAPRVRAARAVNDARPAQVAARIRALAVRFRAPVVALYGLAYKADVQDVRESPALAVARALAADPGIEVIACDPVLDAAPPGVVLVDEAEARARADIVAFLVAHQAFRALSPDLFQDKAVVDAAGLFA